MADQRQKVMKSIGLWGSSHYTPHPFMPPICRAQQEVLPGNMRHEFVHYNNTNQDQQSDEQRCCPKLVLGSSKSPSRRVYILLATFTYGVGKSPKKSHPRWRAKRATFRLMENGILENWATFTPSLGVLIKKGSLFTNWLQMQMKSNFFCGKEMMAASSF